MRIRGRGLCAPIILLALGFSVVDASAADVFVSPAGDDAASGTVDQPVATLGRARELVRALRAETEHDEPIVVHLHEGTYFAAEGVHFTIEDSGTPQSPTVYRGEPGKLVRVTGARSVGNFTSADAADPVVRRIDASVRKNVVVADLKSQGIHDFGTFTADGYDRPMQVAPSELFVDHRPLCVARWPNLDWDRTSLQSAPPHSVRLEGNRAARWKHEPDAWLHGFWSDDWSDYREKITAIDARGAIVRVTESHGDHDFLPGARYFAVNMAAELDAPGEYFLDRSSGRLYAWLPEGANLDTAELSVVDSPVSFYGVSHLRWEGITIDGARSCGLEIVGGEDIVVAHAEIRNCGNLAINVYGGLRHHVTHCILEDLGHGACRIEGGDRRTLEAGEHVVEHCRMARFNRLGLAGRPAVNVYGVGHRVANNTIRDGSGGAIVLHGNEHLVEANDIGFVCLHVDDVGAISLAHDWTERGNVIRHNYVHDLGTNASHCVVGVYLDDFASGTTVSENIFERAGRGIIVGGGRDNTITDNLFVDCRAGVQVDRRGTTWRADHFDGGETRLFDALQNSLAVDSPYAEKYPALAELHREQPAEALGNRIEQNVFACKRPIDLHDGLDHRIVALVDNVSGTDARNLAEQQREAHGRYSPSVAAKLKAIRLERVAGLGSKEVVQTEVLAGTR